MTTIIQTKPTRDMVWGEAMLCLEILALCAGIQPMDTEQFFRKPNEIYSKYFVNKLTPALCCISEGLKNEKEKTENKLNELISSMDPDQFMTNEPLSAEAFFEYHRSELRPLYYKISYLKSRK